jgi:hypothetical protein
VLWTAYTYTPKNNVLVVSGTRGRGHWFLCAGVVGVVSQLRADCIRKVASKYPFHNRLTRSSMFYHIHKKKWGPKHLETCSYINNILRPKNLNLKERPYVIQRRTRRFYKLHKERPIDNNRKALLPLLITACKSHYPGNFEFVCGSSKEITVIVSNWK